MKENLIVVGGGGHAKSVIDVIQRLGTYTILGYCDPNDNGPILGVPYLGDDNQLSALKEKYDQCCAVLGVGITVEVKQKRMITENLESLGFIFPRIISPSAIIARDVVIGEGTVVLNAAIVNASAQIGKYSVINTASVVEHDCQIGDYVFIAPTVVLCGGVEVGAGSTIGANATVIQYKKIAEGCLIGAGSVVSSDCVEAGTYLGTTAKRL